ncbi:geranylgeranyl reductase family protein [Candidatus Woesearchaeota archaeon]|nr:geranylgeranyl reductase family protein [Candidatus Woesearchaeota archaeon]
MIVIVGAGPVGCFLGYLLAKEGRNVAIYEEHAIIGKPIQCTGLVTKELSSVVKLKKEFILNRLNIARVCSYNNSVEVGINEYVLDRVKFDKHLADLAVKSGAKIIHGAKVIDIGKNEIFIKSKKGKVRVKADIIIGADGPNSIIAKKINKIKRRNYVGLQARIKGNFDDNQHITYFGDVCPGFFAWVVPESKKIARIGLACEKDVKGCFDRLLKKLKINNNDIINKQAGLMPLYDKKLKVQERGMYLVGDAATQVKATTGGGLVFGLKAAKILADCIINGKDYTKRLKKLNKELSIHLKIRSILNRFNDKDFSYLIKLVRGEKVQSVLKNSNREYPSKLMLKLLFNEPRFLFFMKKLF